MGKKTEEFNFVPPLSSKNNNKINPVAASMINVGALVVYIAAYGASKGAGIVSELASAARKSISSTVSIKDSLTAAKDKFASVAGSFAGFNRKFADRVKTVGFGSAVKLQVSDVVNYVKKNRPMISTVVNHTVPVAAVALLVGVVYNTASASYGITVECNGTELGVVAAESVVADAQMVIADKAVYRDTENEIYVTANLSIKPLNAYDEVIDEVALAEKLEEHIVVTAPVEEEPESDESIIFRAISEASEITTAGEAANEGKVRAYVVTVDGEKVGAVENTEKLEGYLDSIKKGYEAEDVVEVSFDKDVEYGYEDFVNPAEVVDSEVIINKLESIVSEPVYYEIQLGDNPWNIARDHDMTLDQLTSCFASFDGKQIDDITEFCPVGAMIQLSAEVPYLQVMVTKNVTYTEAVDYEIIQTEDPDMYKGDKKVDVKGIEGEAEVTALVTYKDGMPVATEVLERVVTVEPVAQEQRVGTRKTSTAVSTGSGGSGVYFWPVGGGKISDYFGGYRNHKGLDIAAPYGTPVYAAESGTVTETGTGWNGGYGNAVAIYHEDGNVTYYAHMSSIAINYGDYVVKGQIIGYVGSTGSSTGNHLHFEVRSGSYYNDPCDYVSQY